MDLTYIVQWKACKKDFETLTGKKKPAEKTLGIFRKSSSLEDALKKVDKAYADLGVKNGKGTLEAKDIATYDKVVLAFKKDGEKYIKLLEATLAKEADADSAYGKAVVMLKKRIKAMTVTMNTMGVTYANQLTAMTAKEKAVAVVIPGTQSGLKKMSAFLAKVEAQKTVETKVAVFNSGIVTAARDITQNIKNAMSFQKKGMVTWKGKDLDGVVKIMTAWANDGRALPKNADAAGVKKEMSALVQVVKAVKEWVKANS
ncbi:hypothetical protein Pla52o_29880 [Novipirellula galeiformis]|uniref:Uncharacterized protein n=1 Tax=Novipirellula galeiformis TaxID=2528004 RepID=A0A5C6CGZ0_9BACT|nr:hypothetical protein [Novipirellula galeiformis]TWU23452.1 hypothetical protein Pla52o_29880 [Novipirellula galeiformis]